MASPRNSRNLIWSGLWIYSVATGLASMIFMAWAFYVETTGRGALFIEPNRVLAAGVPGYSVSSDIGLFLTFVPRPLLAGIVSRVAYSLGYAYRSTTPLLPVE